MLFFFQPESTKENDDWCKGPKTRVYVREISQQKIKKIIKNVQFKFRIEKH